MFFRRPKVRIDTERMCIELPRHRDFRAWCEIRAESQDFLTRWEPIWSEDHLTRKGFVNRVYWANRAAAMAMEFPFLMHRRSDGTLLGGVTLSNIRRRAACAGTVGYWIGERFARQGYMREALEGLVHFAFNELDLSRLEAGCLPENQPSRGVLEKVGFKYEGVAQSYLQINGRWRNHVLYAYLRSDRRGKTLVG